jgi:hypothetical protein
MRLNTASAIPKIYTHEGAVAKRITPEQLLRRSVLSCLLWEKEPTKTASRSPTVSSTPPIFFRPKLSPHWRSKPATSTASATSLCFSCST